MKLSLNLSYILLCLWVLGTLIMTTVAMTLSLSLSLTSRLSASISLFVARAGARAPVFVSNLTNHYSMVCGFSVQASVFAEVCLKNVYNL